MNEVADNLPQKPLDFEKPLHTKRGNPVRCFWVWYRGACRVGVERVWDREKREYWEHVRHWMPDGECANGEPDLRLVNYSRANLAPLIERCEK